MTEFEWQWGERSLSLNESLEIRLGTLAGQLIRREWEWDLEFTYTQDRYVNETTLGTTKIRSIAEQSTDKVLFEPSSADRNVVARPAQAIQLPHGERVTLFITTPLWLRCLVSDTVIADVPLEIMSDSWFGTNTRVGEICYSNQTRAQVSTDELQDLPGRLITPATIANDGADTVVVDRLNLPLPMLSIYQARDVLWTNEVRITRTGELDAANMEILEEAPSFVEVTKMVGPRRVADPNLLNRTLGVLFK